jgi:hypothetical protein
VAKRERSKAGVDSSGVIRYFFLNGQLHKKLIINRAADQITAWCYPLGKRVAYTYSDMKMRYKPAYSTKEVSAMLNRHRVVLERCMARGDFSYPQFTYTIDEHRNKGAYYWSEENIMEAHAFFLTQHYGRPRKDGIVTPKPMPTARELRAMIRQEQVMYVKNADGEFVPTWKAQDFT